ncbi:NifX-associated nitrogen fixation protein [Aestuariirhabdus litorea]|uniref:NifX-associated nitrogen fixation protein n=1 Tax=Aestuariirhabdus litorea TaxID=2528527 RepID=A0A3P3VJI9_9GAMM|nr:NifX-associated nitrogen fixation protein [Aestuariirhabdus litorea]RRJ82921.1 NifX-associated nitrogen fixation protein [Aestuariirhabdus litorea]RWW93080.1 NifX-associated nitrogen fixation protein [Endozoicomonadaceae bacterium GTF-13]
MYDEMVISDTDPLLESEFIIELVRHLRALDSYGAYEKWSDARILDPLIMTRERKKEMPLIADPDDVTLSNIRAYYNALALTIERECGHLCSPLISLSHEGFGRVLITVGKLVVMDRVLRDAHLFGFRSLEALKTESDKILNQAQAMVSRYPAVAAI